MTNPLKKIVLTTLGVHFALIIYLTIESTPPPPKPNQKKVAVNTVALNQKRQEVIQPAPQKQEVKQAPPQKEEVKEAAPQKKEVKKADPEKVVTEVHKEKAAQPKKNGELLNKAKKALAKMEKIEAHSNTASQQEEESDYSVELIKRLKLQMHLPEFGQVEVLLTLERSGKVSSVEVVDSKSRWNKKYVENTLPSLIFPDFGKWYPKEDKHTFTLTLSNELD